MPIFKFFPLFFLIFSVSCASHHKKLLEAPLGLTKNQALNRFGEPSEKYRKEGLDHWIYKSLRKAKSSKGKILYTHTLVFEEGTLQKSFFTRSFTRKELQMFYSE